MSDLKNVKLFSMSLYLMDIEDIIFYSYGDKLSGRKCKYDKSFKNAFVVENVTDTERIEFFKGYNFIFEKFCYDINQKHAFEMSLDLLRFMKNQNMNFNIESWSPEEKNKIRNISPPLYNKIFTQ